MASVPTPLPQGREKINLVYLFTKMGFSILVSDVDTVWMRNPLPYMAQYPEADVLTSSDHLVQRHIALPLPGVLSRNVKNDCTHVMQTQQSRSQEDRPGHAEWDAAPSKMRPCVAAEGDGHGRRAGALSRGRLCGQHWHHARQTLVQRLCKGELSCPTAEPCTLCSRRLLN